MLRLRLNLVKFVLQCVIFLLPACAFGIAAYLRFFTTLFPPAPAAPDWRAYVVLLFFASIAWGFISTKYGLATPQRLFASARKSRRIAVACATTYVATLVAMFFYRDVQFSRLFIVLSCICLFFLTVACQVLLRLVLETMRRGGKYCLHALIIGADEFAVGTADRILHGQITPCQIVGYVALPGQRVAVQNAPLHHLEDLPRLAIGNGIDEAILAVPQPLFAEVPAIVERLDPLCVPIRAVLNWGDGVKMSDQLFDFGGIPMLDLKPTAAESISYVVMKRTFDLLFSLLVLLLTLPVTIAIAIAIRFSSPGPIFFAQERVGLKGQIFRMYKFRTMRITTVEEAGTRWTIRHDPRCTKLGAFLRRTSLDELPQFLNVLKGDMSVVGPRPERPFFVRKFSNELHRYNSRHYVKAGITGWAQVNGFRGDTSITKRVQYDLYYLRHWSIGFDLQIILLTLVRGLTDRNAY
jgi:Undecaprenyl-phosphate glucose phosphotransferase